MPNQSFSPDIRRYAVAGAQARLTEIAQEAEAIRRAFPELRQTRGPRRRAERVDEQESGGTDALSKGRGRSTMSAAQRKAVGERMKKYWAARRGGTQAATTSTSSERPAVSAAKGRKAVKGGAKRGPRKMSAAVRKRISQAQKKRWAATRAVQ